MKLEFDRPTDQPTNRPTDRAGQMEVSLLIRGLLSDTPGLIFVYFVKLNKNCVFDRLQPIL